MYTILDEYDLRYVKRYATVQEALNDRKAYLREFPKAEEVVAIVDISNLHKITTQTTVTNQQEQEMTAEEVAQFFGPEDDTQGVE